MKSILVCLFLSLVCLPTLAQHCTLRGQVIEKQSRQPVAGAIILLVGSNRSSITDRSGRYEFQNLYQGHYSLICRLIGYQTDTIRTNLIHEEQEQDLHLQEADIHLQDVVVTAHKQEESTLPRTVLEGPLLDQTRGKTLAEALQNVTGVTTLQTGNSIGKPIIHGLHSNRVLILNNGTRQEGQQWGSEHAPEIDPFVAKRLTVVKGAAGVRYGPEAIGGVVLVEPAPLPQQAAVHGEATLIGFTNGRQGMSSVLLEGGIKPISGFSWRVQGTLKRGGNSRTPRYFLANTGISERNFSLAAGYRRGSWASELFVSQFHTEIGIFTGSHIGSLDDLQRVLENGEPFIKSGFSYKIGRPYQDVSHNLQKLKVTHTTAQSAIFTFTLAHQQNSRSEYDLHRSYTDSIAALNQPELHFELSTYSGDLLWEHQPIASKLKGSAGMSLQYQRNLVYGRPLIPNFRQVSAGIFWLEKYTANQWELEGGFRYDYRYVRVTTFPKRGVIVYKYLNFGNVSGTIGATRRFGENWESRLNAGMAWRPPNINELYSDGVHHGAAAYEKGDSTLRPETAYNLDFTTQYTGSRFTAELSVYRNYIQNFIYLKPQNETILTIRGAFPYFKHTQVDAVFQGIDFSANWLLLPNWNWGVKYSVVRAKDVRNNARMVQIPPDRVENSIRWERPKTLSGLQKPFVQAGYQYVAKQTIAPENGDFAPPPAAYWLWNASVGGSLTWAKQVLNISLSATNLFNTVYRDYLNRFRYYSDDLGQNISLRMKYSF
ncbi:MAG: TonB-dependent receptor [Siphonobacter sp.]